MIRRGIALLLSLLSVLFLLPSCASPRGGAPFLEFCDSVGNEVKLYAPPRRVAVLFSSFAEMWCLAGGAVAVTVGESVERGLCPKETPLVDAGAGKSIDTERLLALSPDLVLCSADIAAQRQTADLLRTVGIPCAELRVESFEDYLFVLELMTEITQNKEAYRRHGADLKANITALLKNAAEKEEQKILFVRAGTSARATKAKTGKEHFAARMLDELGTYNIAENAPVLLDGLSVEEILREQPAHIFISCMGNEADVRAYMEQLLSTDAWRGLDAVGRGNVHYLSKELFQFKPNARWYEAYLTLWEILYEE